MFHINFLQYVSLLTVGLVCFGGAIQNNVDKNSDLNLISKFLGLQSELCGYVQSCIIRRKTNVKLTVNEDSCCRHCSCDEHCVNTGTCCPDFWLRDVIGDVQFESIEDLMKTFEYIKFTQKQNVSNTFSDSEKIDDTTACVSSRMKDKDLSYGLHYLNEAYVMISFCPQYYNDNVIKSGCEDGLMPLETTSISKLIPVTSASTITTYKNIFCLLCHEGRNTHYKPWKSWMVCSSKNVKQQFITRPTHLFQSVALGYYNYCNIEKEPPSDLQLKPGMCEPADVTSCPNISDIDTKDNSTSTSMYELMCRSYYLPVLVTEATTYTIYKNIACYSCNVDTPLAPVCASFYPTYGEYKLEINVMDVTSNESEQLRPDQSVLSYRYDSTCNTGYIYDEMLKICRKVLCPRHFYIYEGSCVPIIANMQYVYFKIMIEVKPGVLITTTNGRYKQYEKAVDIVLTQELTSAFPEYHIDMWRKATNRKLQSNVVSLEFKNDNDTYATTMQKLQKLLDNIRYLRNDSLNLTADTRIADSIFEHRRFKVFQHLFERETGSELDPVRVSTELYWNEKEFEISKTHLCHRIALNDSEFIRISKYGIKIVRTGVRVDGINFDLTDEDKHLACMYDVILRKTNHVGNTFEESSVTDGTGNLTIFVIFGVLVVFTLLIVTARLIFNFIQRLRTE